MFFPLSAHLLASYEDIRISILMTVRVLMTLSIWPREAASRRERERASKRERARGSEERWRSVAKTQNNAVEMRRASRRGLDLTLLRGALPRAATPGYAPRLGPAWEGCS